MSLETVFITAEEGAPGPGYRIGGMSVLERRVREARRAGAGRIVVACAGELPPELEALVERAPSGEGAPSGAEIVRADELAGVALDSPEKARLAEWRHLQGMMKSFQGLTDAWINRHVSLRLTRLLANTRVMPNHITYVTIAIAVAATVAVALGGSGVVVGACLLQLHNILDSCDGELARLRFQSSRLGQWLDNISDDIADAGFVGAIGRVAGGGWWYVAIVVVIARLYMQADLYRHVIRLGGDFGRFRWWYEADKVSLDDVYAPGSWRTVARAPFRRDTYALVWAVLAVLGRYGTIVVYAAAIFGSQAVVMAVHSWVVRGRRAPVPRRSP